MNKIWLISIGTVIFVGLIALAFWLTNSGGQVPAVNPPVGQNILPTAGTVVSTNTSGTTTNSMSGATILIVAVGGGTIEARNFINDVATAKDPINSGYYYLGYHVNEGFDDPTATDSPPYIIEYINATQFFNISLLKEPIGQVREEAQQHLMTQLGISQNQMCRLNYSLGVPVRVNSQYAGRELGFSFCPGATELPK